MATLILCGLTDEDTPEFLKAERSLLDEIASQKGLNAADVHTLRLKELPDPANAEKVKSLGRELLEAFGLGAGEFQTEFLEKNGFKFLAIRTAGESAPTVFVTGPFPEKPGRPPRRINWKIPARVLGGLALLVLLYYGLGFLLTKVIDGQYADRNCERLVGLAGFVENVYTVKIAPFTEPVSGQALECRAYLDAETLHGQKSWEKASQAFREYGVTYPSGIYSKEAKEQAADSLFELAATQRGKGDYASAVDNLKLLLDEYRDTPSMTKARETLPEVYLEWGQAFRAGQKYSDAFIVYSSLVEWAVQENDSSLLTRAGSELARTYLDWGEQSRAGGKFEEAVTVYLSLTEWAEQRNESSLVTRAGSELARTYFDWGKACRTSGKFEEAVTVYLSLGEWAAQQKESSLVTSAGLELARTYFEWGRDLQSRQDYLTASVQFDKAIATDPDANSANSTATQTRAHLPGFHRAWGEYLINRGNFLEAVEHYKTSISLSAAEDVDDARNALSQAYLQWAESLRKKEDYKAALEKLGLATGSAATSGNQVGIDEVRATTLDQYARSTGLQAQGVIVDATKSICQLGRPLVDPPIIGILDEKRLKVFGVNLSFPHSLPDDILARAPGSLRFVACVEEKKVTVQTCPYYAPYVYGPATAWIERIRYEWHFKVYRSQTGELYKQKTMRGSWPESCPHTHGFPLGVTTDYLYGGKPTADDVIRWLASLLK